MVIKAIEQIAEDQGFKTIEKAQSFTMLIGLQEWITMITSHTTQKTKKPMITMRTRIQKMMKTSTMNMIESTRMNLKI
jgi:hypothetical protein